jgi:hypothetical protein
MFLVFESLGFDYPSSHNGSLRSYIHRTRWFIPACSNVIGKVSEMADSNIQRMADSSEWGMVDIISRQEQPATKELRQ